MGAPIDGGRKAKEKLRSEGEDANERDADPGGAIVELIEELVEGLFKQVGGEEGLSELRLGDEGGAGGDGGAVRLKEGASDGVDPKSGPELEGLRGGVALLVGLERGIGGVGEATEHACYIFEGRLFLAAFGERARGLAFEIEESEVVVGDEDLAEMVIAMDADALPRRLGCGDAVRGGKEGDAAGEDFGGIVGEEVF